MGDLGDLGDLGERLPSRRDASMSRISAAIISRASARTSAARAALPGGGTASQAEVEQDLVGYGVLPSVFASSLPSFFASFRSLSVFSQVEHDLAGHGIHLGALRVRHAERLSASGISASSELRVSTAYTTRSLARVLAPLLHLGLVPDRTFSHR